MRAIAVALIAAHLALAMPVRADAHDAAMARALIAKEKALDSNDPTDWEAALNLFLEADGLRTTSISKYELAVAAARLKEDDLAVESYEAALDLGLAGSAREKANAFNAAHPMARVAIEGTAGARVFIGGRQRGRLPARPFVVFAGSVRIKIVDANGAVTEHDVEVAAGTTAKLDAAPKKQPLPPPIVANPPAQTPTREDRNERPGTALIVIGGATIVVSAAMLISSSIVIGNRRSSLERSCVQRDGDDCIATSAELHEAAGSDRDAIASWKAVRIGSAIGLGAGALAAACGLVWNSTAPARTALSPRTWITGTSLSVGFVGSF